MSRYLLRRTLGALPLLLGVATLIFLVLDLAPGDPTARYFQPGVSPEVLERLRSSFGLDAPLHVRYLKWIGAFATADFGFSLVSGRPVLAMIAETLPNTLLLTGTALVMVFITGLTTGAIQVLRRRTRTDDVLSVVTLFFYSVPSFWLGLMLMLLFSLQAHEWGLPLALPPTGMMSVGYESLGPAAKLGDRLAHLVLPVATLTLVSAAGVARYTRGQLLEVMGQDYIRTARARGLSERAIVMKHALRNAVLPVITLLGLYLPLLFSGAVLVETIFAWPGMGRLTVDAIFQRDYPVVMATSFVFAGAVIVGNLLADALYAVADPRIRYR